MELSERILLVEDSRFFSSVLVRYLEEKIDLPIDPVTNVADAAKALNQKTVHYVLAILDLHLPDSPNGEIVATVAPYGVPSIVFSAELTAERRHALAEVGVIDSVLKSSPASLDYTVSLVVRLINNRDLAALVVDDSNVMRASIGHQLRRQLLTVYEAENGAAGLEVLAQHDDIRLVLTDYEMPTMDGFDMIRRIRRHWTKTRLAVIGMSANSDTELSARFIKFGANDFIYKPFGSEELLCRVSQNLDMLELFADIEYAATRDALTGLFNRRYLIRQAPDVLARTRGKTELSAVAILDIDFFKKVNDTYGHDAGDTVIRAVAQAIERAFADDEHAVVARIGGEEFCVVHGKQDRESLQAAFENLRLAIRGSRVTHQGTDIAVTISGGVTIAGSLSLDTAMKQADELLYQAKNGGRDQICFSE